MVTIPTESDLPFSSSEKHEKEDGVPLTRMVFLKNNESNYLRNPYAIENVIPPTYPIVA